MQIWLIQNGEKQGPFADYQIRQRIEAGHLDADTPAWHEGIGEWTTLRNLSIFESEFHKPTPPEAPENAERQGGDPATKDLKTLFLARRFWARWVDLQLYITVWWLLLWISNRDVGSIFANPWILLVQLLPWLPIEALLLHYHGTTPGKWLLGIQVKNEDGTALSKSQSATRSLRVLVAGVGLGWGFVSVVCQGISYWLTRRLGRTMWDHLGGHRVDFSPIRNTRYFLAIGIIFAAMHLQVAVLLPHMIPHYQEHFPALKEYIEKNPPKHFPERYKAPER